MDARKAMQESQRQLREAHEKRACNDNSSEDCNGNRSKEPERSGTPAAVE